MSVIIILALAFMVYLTCCAFFIPCNIMLRLALCLLNYLPFLIIGYLINFLSDKEGKEGLKKLLRGLIFMIFYTVISLALVIIIVTTVSSYGEEIEN